MFLLKAEQMKRYEKEKVGIVFLTFIAQLLQYLMTWMTRNIY